ncbi:MAG: hypothetical protein ACRDQA_18990 [Nocardioidaceae bacterium]
MTVRAIFHDPGEAGSMVDTLQTAGFDAGMEKEREASDDMDSTGTVVYVVHTDAPATEVDELAEEFDAKVEIKDPTTGAVAPVQPPGSAGS